MHNLKNIDLEIPKKEFIVITGVSGSGKSSLAFDTIYAEGQRRYVESLSSYARQFLDRIEKPKIDKITGLCPAIALEQKISSSNPRSTVGTKTEIYDYLKLLFSRFGKIFSPISGKEVKKDSISEIIDQIKKQSLPSIHVVNKVDRFKDKTKILEFLKNHSYLEVFSDVIPVSAKYQKNLDSLLSVIKDYLPHNELDYDDKLSTDQDLHFRISEALRERLMENLKDELPYKFNCAIETMEDKGKVFLIEIAILVNKQAHKKIIIGKEGQLLKKIGSEARAEIEKILNRQVYLSTYIRVVKPGRRK